MTFVPIVRGTLKNVQTMIIVEVDQFIRETIERQAHLVKTFGQFLENVVQLAAPRGRV